MESRRKGEEGEMEERKERGRESKQARKRYILWYYKDQNAMHMKLITKSAKHQVEP